MTLAETLTQFGLNEKEAKVYLAALELGPSSILQISQKSGVNRSSIYYVIDDLIKKNLMNLTVQKKKKVFVPAEPSEIIKLIKEKEELLKSVLPDLNTINNLSVKKPKIRFYEGEEGMHRVIREYLTADKQAYTFGNHDAFNASMKIDPDIINKRIKNKINLKMISADTPDSKGWQKTDKTQLRETKIVSNKKYPFQTEITLYNNKVSLTSYQEKIGIIIESKPISETLKMIFNLCWNNLK